MCTFSISQKSYSEICFEGSMSGKRKVQKSNPTTSILRMGGLWYLLLFLILGTTQEVNRFAFFFILSTADSHFEANPETFALNFE